jgi:hypothetical protein
MLYTVDAMLPRLRAHAATTAAAQRRDGCAADDNAIVLAHLLLLRDDRPLAVLHPPADAGALTVRQLYVQAVLLLDADACITVHALCGHPGLVVCGVTPTSTITAAVPYRHVATGISFGAGVRVHDGASGELPGSWAIAGPQLTGATHAATELTDALHAAFDAADAVRRQLAVSWGTTVAHVPPGTRAAVDDGAFDAAALDLLCELGAQVHYLPATGRAGDVVRTDAAGGLYG